MQLWSLIFLSPRILGKPAEARRAYRQHLLHNIEHDVRDAVTVYFSVVNRVRRLDTTPVSWQNMPGLFTSRVRAALSC